MLVFQGVHPFSTKGINFRVSLVFLSRGSKALKPERSPHFGARIFLVKWMARQQSKEPSWYILIFSQIFSKTVDVFPTSSEIPNCRPSSEDSSAHPQYPHALAPLPQSARWSIVLPPQIFWLRLIHWLSWSRNWASPSRFQPYWSWSSSVSACLDFSCEP